MLRNDDEIERVKSQVDPWYVTGFAEGEACFTFNRSDRNFTLVFAIKLNASDLSVLREIQHFFGGIGRIYHVPARGPESPSSGLAKAAEYYRVSRMDELGRVIGHFDDFPLRGAKAASYGIWRQMFVVKRDTFRRPDRVTLQALAHALSHSAVRNRPWAP